MCASTHSLRYCIISGHHGRIPVDGTSRTRQTSLGRASGKLLTLIPSSMAHSSCAVLGVYAHHEAISAHAISTPLSHPKLSPPMVVGFWFHHRLQCDVHLCINFLLLANISSMVSRLLLHPKDTQNLQEPGTSRSRTTNASIDQHSTSPTQS